MAAGAAVQICASHLNLDQGSLNYGSRARCGPRSHFVNNEKIIYSTYDKFVDLVEYDISRNDHIA